MKSAQLLYCIITVAVIFGLFGCKQDLSGENLSKPSKNEDIAIAMSPAIPVTSSIDEGKQKWTECAIPLPEKNVKLTFLRRHIHPFMAEYSRKVRVSNPDDKPVYCPLPINVGGRTLINVYWIDEKDDFGPLVLLRDRWGESLVDLNAKETLRLVWIGSDRIFAGRIDDEKASAGWMGSSDGYVQVHVGQNTATEITRYGINDRLQYLGRLDGRFGPVRFISASKASEIDIEIIKT